MKRVTRPDAYYSRRIKPLNQLGLCSRVKCGKPLFAHGLCEECYKENFPSSRPLANQAAVWCTVDWSLSNKEIAALTNRSIPRVSMARKKHCAPCPHCGSIHPKIASKQHSIAH